MRCAPFRVSAESPGALLFCPLSFFAKVRDCTVQVYFGTASTLRSSTLSLSTKLCPIGPQRKGSCTHRYYSNPNGPRYLGSGAIFGK